MTTRQIARGILVAVGLFVVAIVGILVVRGRTMHVESTGPAPATADFRINDVRIEEESGNVRWRLSAEQVLVYESEGRTSLRKISVSVQEPGQSWTIVGDEGDLFQRAKRVEVRGNVVLTSSEGVRLETQVLRWQGDRNRLWTDAPVTLSQGGVVVRGNTLSLLLEEDTTAIEGQVRATFRPGRPG
jgi:LPS export ABC transporter protein LptC